VVTVAVPTELRIELKASSSVKKEKEGKGKVTYQKIKKRGAEAPPV